MNNFTVNLRVLSLVLLASLTTKAADLETPWTSICQATDHHQIVATTQNGDTVSGYAWPLPSTNFLSAAITDESSK